MTTTYIYGIRAILEALENDQEIEKVFLAQNVKSPLFRTLETQLRNEKVPHSYVPDARMQKFNDRNHQGAVARVSPVKFVPLESLIEEAIQLEVPPTFILLDGLTDPRNLGAIFRTAAAQKVNGIVLPQSGGAPLNADAIKTSAGGVFSVPVAQVAHLKDAAFLFQQYEIPLMALTEKTSESIYALELNQPLALVLGNEEKGIHPSLLKLCSLQGKLPMQGSIASLNVSVACGVCLYEIYRQRNF
ncbi:MAG: 23S rRNA (guanosine(2251)-2'-O)-methyltransferase RlmB [Flavobacteriaceae bacterium]